ncbi:hypothetical protein Mpet_1686 [Methanolacinia petrolearia DSM 11571]|uniref:Uncharacterized protein n=1 Tax=Methanolacinia petrolearia (strain DSM 11571 / OCM 486 / SEBR 4847) TaxID=679926 RepID=E1RHD5_METP4|nr:hypothetical protein Mpet_1686 [Methanolacinia petrolearia DSM 11571]
MVGDFFEFSGICLGISPSGGEKKTGAEGMPVHPDGDYRHEGEGSREGEIIPLPVSIPKL